SRLRIGQVVEDADRVDEVEAAALLGWAKRQSKEVALDDLHRLERAQNVSCGLDGAAEVEADDAPCPVLRCEEAVPPGPVAGVQHELVAERLRLERAHPVEKLPLKLWMLIREVCPLRAERVCGARLELGHVGRHEAWDVALDRPVLARARAHQLAL